MKNIENEQTNKGSIFSYEFKAFSPLIMDMEPNIYDYELDQIYNNENIKNIAITGIYGAGKSSVLLSMIMCTTGGADKNLDLEIY